MTTPDFTKMVPGFDFLQGLLKGAGQSLPSLSQWIAPTLDAEEVDKRITELRTVQYWLEQNAKMLGATIQALEVQRMSLATLKAMNVPMNELRDSMKIDPDAIRARPLPPRPEPQPAAPDRPAARARAPRRSQAEASQGVVDPMQWWGALSRQFAELAAHAVKDTPVQAATQMAGAAFDKAMQPVASAAKAAAGSAASAPRKAARAPRSSSTAPSAGAAADRRRGR